MLPKDKALLISLPGSSWRLEQLGLSEGKQASFPLTLPCELRLQADQGQSCHSPGQSPSESALAEACGPAWSGRLRGAWSRRSLCSTGLQGSQHSAPENGRQPDPPLMIPFSFVPSCSPTQRGRLVAGPLAQHGTDGIHPQQLRGTLRLHPG